MVQRFGSPGTGDVKGYEHGDITHRSAVRAGKMAGQLSTCALRSLYPIHVSETLTAQFSRVHST